MPRKPGYVTWPPRRTTRNTARKSIPNFNSTSTIHFGTLSAAAATPSTSTSSVSSQEAISIHTSDTRNIPNIRPHATIPASQTQSQGSQKTLASNSGFVDSDMGFIDGNNYEELGKSFDSENTRVEHCGPEKVIHVEATTVMGSGDESKNVDDLSSPPVERPPVQDEGSVEAVTGAGSEAVGVAGSGNGKRKIVKKTVRIVKRVIKKRVPKRVLVNGSENQGVVVRTEDGVNLSEVRKETNLANDVIEKSNVVDEVAEKTGSVDEAKGVVVNRADGLTENSNLVNDVTEGYDLVERVTEKTSSVDEVMETANITDEVAQMLKLVNGDPTVSEPIIGKNNDQTGVAYMESERSKLNLSASISEEMVPANDQTGIDTTDTESKKSSDVVSEADRKDSSIHAPNLIGVEKVNYTPETIMETKEIANIMKEAQSKGLVVENEKIDTVNEVDVELLTGQNVGPVGETSVVLGGGKSQMTTSKAESDCEVESGRIGLTEGLLLSGEMGVLERKKRRKTEIFLGGLDMDTKEDDIRKVFGEAGVIVEVRLVMSKSGKGRGYAFLRFATAADAKNALEKYSKVEICGKQCNAAPVEGNDTIFLGNIDKNWKIEDVLTLLGKAGIEKIDEVTLKADPKKIEKNRGFAFVEFQTSKDAQIAFNKLQKKNAFGKKQMVKVAWAQPLTEPADEEILQVKSVYAEYLPSSWDEEKVKDYFKRFGEIENVVLAKDLPSSRRKDFAFINYTTRDAALTCIGTINKEKLEDDCSKVKMAVSLAKPIPKRKQMKHTSDLTSKQHFKAKQEAFQTSKKLHEPRNRGKAASSSCDHVKVDNSLSTNDELVQILRQQASSKHIPSHPWTGTDIPDHHFSLPGSKRPFSLVGHDPLYMEHQGFSRPRLESSYSISGPRSSSHGIDLLSFPYHRQGPGFVSESVDERRIYPSHFQTREQAPYHADNNEYHRY